MSARVLAAAFAFPFLSGSVALAQLTVTVTDISPDTSSLDAANPNGASGGRVNGLAVDRTTPARRYAASEWGGLFRSVDGGVRWSHLDGHLPQATWDVEVDPTNSNRVYATSFYDGRANSRSGINVSNDAGATWTHPVTATPPANFCFTETRRLEPVAFGISIDPANSNRVRVGTNCGLAMSTNAGATWNFVDPTPADRARNVWDVVVHDGGIIDVCGDDGHRRSTDGGVNWATATSQPLPAGRCSLAVSPDEPYVLFAVVGTSIFESDDGGGTWPVTYANPMPQGRIPFVATNQRAGATFDLWFGDVNLFRATCTTPSPANPGGAQRCPASGTWANAQAGAHWDAGDITFAPGVAADACPTLFSNDGGVYRNTLAASPGCNAPNWEQPTVTPHALFNYAFAGSARAGAQPEDVYMGNQDNGSFGTVNAGAPAVTWTNERCCDGFDVAGENTRGVSTICCFNIAPATRMFLSGAGLAGATAEIGNYPAGTLRSFQHLGSVLNFGPDDYFVGTTAGLFVTLNIAASPITWTQLGAGSTPGNACGAQVAFTSGTPTFFAKSGGCNGDQAGTLWRHQGTAAGGTWTQVPSPGVGGIGVFGVDRNDPRRLIASDLGGVGGPRMVRTLDGGATWTPLPALDALMTGGGTFPYSNTSGPTIVPGGASMRLNGYAQPTLVAFDPADPDIVAAAGADSGVFLSTNGGSRWQLVTDPHTPGASGRPHVPRPYYAHFDHGPGGGDINLFLGTRGRGAWRLTFKKAAMAELQVPAPPDFLETCVGATVRAPVLLCNTSLGDLIVSSVTSSNAQFSVVSPSGGFPITISHDFCFPVEVAFTPTSPGPQTADLVIASNDPSFPSLTVAAAAAVGRPAAVTMIADTGSFGELCPSPPAFRDLDLTVNNSGSCPLLISSVSSSAPASFDVPQVMTYPVKVAPGDSVAMPIRFVPSLAGSTAAAITVATNDPVTPARVVNVTGTAPPEYVCEPPVFAALAAAIGPTWGTGATGDYTVDAGGRVLAPFGATKVFGFQGEGEYLYYPRRHEGQLDAGLLYRRGPVQFGAGAGFKRASLHGESSTGALGHAVLGLDLLQPTFRIGLFGAKGVLQTDVVTTTESLGVSGTIVANERVLHSVDQLGLAAQVELVPDVWLDGHIEWLHRHPPGVSDTAGGALRVTMLVASNIALTAQLDVNESFIGSNAVGTVTVGVTVGRWARPKDYANPRNPLGTLLPRVHWEVFDRVRP